MPFLRSTTNACSRSPLASVRAFLQSIMGAPDLSRSSLTCAAEIFGEVLIACTNLSYDLLRCHSPAQRLLLNTHARPGVSRYEMTRALLERGSELARLEPL